MHPNNAPTEAPTCPSLPPDTPSISKVGNNSDTDAQSESEELAVLDKVVHIGQNVFDSAEFVHAAGEWTCVKISD